MGARVLVAAILHVLVKALAKEPHVVRAGDSIMHPTCFGMFEKHRWQHFRDSGILRVVLLFPGFSGILRLFSIVSMHH